MGEDPIASAAGTTEGMGIGEHSRSRMIDFAHMSDDQRGECLLPQAPKMGALRRRVGFFRDTEDTVLECRQAPAIRVISNVLPRSPKRHKSSRGEIGLLLLNPNYSHMTAPEQSTPSYPPTARSPPAEHAVFHYHRFAKARAAQQLDRPARHAIGAAHNGKRTIAKRLQLRQSPGKLVERYVERTHDVAEFSEVVL